MTISVAKTLAPLAIAISAIAVTSPAYAEPTPAPTTSTQPTKNPIEQYRIDRENYLAAMNMRSLQMKIINSNFKIACDRATFEFKKSMSTARTPDQKNLAIAARKSAISAAIIARDDAIAALGAEPIEPMEPAKPMKISGKSKNR